jgi:hypothetical protein
MLAAATATGAEKKALPARGPAAGNTQIMLFNQTPAASYTVRRNHVSSGTVIAAPSGIVVYETNAATGDRFEFLAGGVMPVTPAPPTHLSVRETTPGCASVSWTRSSEPEVAGYRVYFGTRPRTQAAYTDSLDAGSAANANQCGLGQGNYYFAVRAYTASGAMSAYTRELALRAADTPIAPHVAIVPDGYWLNDISRPLEVRDLPARWTVRIFDTSGACVRRHENATEGATWTWDFHNERGTRVAPALYLVCVTDGAGAVQRRGRFLVQAAR